MITTANLFNYRIKEFLQFMRNALMIVNQHGPDKLQIKAQYHALNKLHQRLERTYQQNDEEALNQELIQLDAARDQAIVCLRMLSEGYTRHHRDAHRRAGQRVLNCIDKYGSRLYNLNHSAETATLKKIVHDLQANPACLEALRLLHLEDTVAETKRTNQEFERQFVRQLEAASQAEGRRVRDLVQHSATAYRTLVDHVQAHALLSPSAEYTLFGHHFSENVEHFNQLVARRKPTAEAPTEEPTDVSAETGEEVSEQQP